MRCVSLQAFPPHKYNVQAPTANPFQMMRYAPELVQMSLYHFEGAPEHAKSSEESLRLLPLYRKRAISRPTGLGRVWNLALARSRGLPGSVGMFPPSKAAVKELNDEDPELVWMYPHWLIDWVPRLQCENIVITGPDSAVLHNERALAYGSLNASQRKREQRLLRRNTKLERSLGKMNVRVHMVGRKDAERFEELTGHKDKAFFVPHPLYDYIPVKESIAGAGGKLKVLLSGGGGKVFEGDHLQRITAILERDSVSLRTEFSFKFIGRGYDECIGRLKRAGFEVTQADWVEDYENELASAHLHLFPQAVGTGTKGRVLSALATGLLCLGSEFAFENIEIDTERDCFLYREPEETVHMLHTIVDDRQASARIARIASEKVRTMHDPKRTSRTFWNLAAKR